MSREVLNPSFTGLFGKLPTTGDFIARGLPDAFRRNWDAWVSRHLAARLRAGAIWPEGGLRFRLVSGGRVAAGLILSGRDSAGRGFPLSLLVVGPNLPGPDGIDMWCAAALPAARAALASEIDADTLLDRLRTLVVPPAVSDPAAPPMLFWSPGRPPETCTPDAPDAALDRALAVAV